MTDRRYTRTRLPLVVLAAGILLVVTSIVLISRSRSAPTDAGSLPIAAPASAGMRSAPDVSTAATSSAESVTSRIPPSSAGLASSTGLRASTSLATAAIPPSSIPAKARGSSPSSAPVRAATSSTAAARSTTPASPSPSDVDAQTGAPAELRLPSLNVTAEIDPVVSRQGVLQVPDDISRVGWWKYSVPPGSSAGSTVLDGHIDSAADGEGALFHLADLGPGDRVAVTTASGRTIDYEVQARRVYVKAQGLPADLFTQTGPPRLVIISCGGTFDPSIRSYEENIAIFAVPVTS